MPVEDFIISMCCCVDKKWEALTGGKRQRQQKRAVTVELLESFGMRGRLHRYEGDYRPVFVVEIYDLLRTNTHLQLVLPI